MFTLMEAGRQLSLAVTTLCFLRMNVKSLSRRIFFVLSLLPSNKVRSPNEYYMARIPGLTTKYSPSFSRFAPPEQIASLCLFVQIRGDKLPDTLEISALRPCVLDMVEGESWASIYRSSRFRTCDIMMGHRQVSRNTFVCCASELPLCGSFS